MNDDPRLQDGSFGSDRLSRLSNLGIDIEGAGEDGALISPLLLPHPDDHDSGGWDGDDNDEPFTPRLLGGSEYVQQNLYMAAWLGMLVAGWGVGRGACAVGLPTDCLRHITFLEVFSDLTSLFLFGLALGWLIGVNESIRFRWLFSRRRWYMWLIYFATPPIYSAISDISALKHSLAPSDSPWSLAFIILWGSGMAAAAASIAWHVAAAWRRGSAADFWVYVGLRAAVLVWFGTAAAVVAGAPDVHLHLHHLYLGWALALWAEFNRPLSAVTLAIGCGIFVQGVAAYSFAPVFHAGGCFETPAAAEVKCRFWAAAPFTVQVCPADGQPPSYSC